MANLQDNLVKKPNQKEKFTKEKIQELYKCMNDPIYFCEKFVKIQHPTKGRVQFKPFDYQKRIISAYNENRFSVILTGRQLGKTTCAVTYILWRALFRSDQEILLVSNKQASALEITKRIRYAYDALPNFLKAGSVTWNKGTLEFDNGSIIVARATTPDAARGMSLSLLYSDEFSFVPARMQREFWSSIRPTLSEGGDCIITSTPNSDQDQFAHIWKQAIKTQDEYGNEKPDGTGENGFKAIKVSWEEHPERDEEWAQNERAALGEEEFLREHCGEFISFDETLISSLKLKELEGIEPLEKMGTVRWYERPKPKRTYIAALDPSLGTGGDYSAIQVLMVPEMRQIAEWRHNRTDPKGQIKILRDILNDLAEVLREEGDEEEPEIYWTVENNTLGEASLQVIDDTGEEYFPGMFVSEPKKSASRRKRKGLTTTNRRKVDACAKMRSLIESDRLIVQSKPLIRELKNFIAVGNSFKAKQGETDDLVMSLLLAVRVLMIIQDWDPDLEKAVRDSIVDEDEEVDPMPIAIV